MSAVVSLGAALLTVGAVAATARLSAGPDAWTVVGAHVRRQAIAMASYRFRIAMAAVNAALLLAFVFVVGRDVVASTLASNLPQAAGDLALYLFVGVVAWPTVWMGFRASAETVRREQMMGTLEVIEATPVGLEALPFAALVARSLGAILAATATFTVVFLLFPIPEVHLAALPVALAAVILAGLFLWGFGLVFGVLTLVYKELGGTANLFRLGLAGLTGAFIPLAVFPGWLAGLAEAIPLTLAFELVRASLFGSLTAGYALPRVGVLAGSAVVSVFLGTRIFRWGLRKAKRAGRFEGY